MFWFSVFFVLSGLCSIVYELVWLRLAMAKFGVNTALVSIVLSVFMAGLGAGSWIAGRYVRRSGARPKLQPLKLYGFVELAIGLSALVVPLELELGSRVLERVSGGASISSGLFYLLSGMWLILTLVPWSACMGATIPIAMYAIGQRESADAPRSFSRLYLANVVGAVAGACSAPVLIELYGFHGTLRVGALLNALIFVAAFVLASNFRRATADPLPPVPSGATPAVQHDNTALFLLFTTGLTTMGMEVVWIRLYTVFVGPVVYSFAAILAVYLAATFVGSKVYRIWSNRSQRTESALVWMSLAFFGLLPLVTADPRLLGGYRNLRVLLGVAPFAGIVGFLTPMLVDRWSGGDPDRAGRAYAVNVVGCILGPLVAGFVLLPWFGEHMSMLIFVLPWVGMALFGALHEQPAWRLAASAAIVIAAVTLFFFTRDYEGQYLNGIVLRDSTATVIASGKGMEKQLVVNGVGMTVLTPVTKMMAHFTLAHLPKPPRNALIICFGMGTTFRSAMSWGIPVTVVELVPSVPKLFTFYHPDGEALLTSPRAHIVIDDGRRFLDRSVEKFDAVIIDPPPPIDAAGSSLLYTREFYLLIRDHLNPGGILQQWFFTGDDADKAAATRAIVDVFPYVRVYGCMNFGAAYHFLASMQPIPQRTEDELLLHMPPEAVTDMMEWGPGSTGQEQFRLILSQRIPAKALIALSPTTPEMEDDRPINEYYRIRAMFPKVVQAATAGN